MQMQRGRSNAARVMKPAEETQAGDRRGAGERTDASAAAKFGRQNARMPYSRIKRMRTMRKNVQTAASGGNGMENGVSNFRMQQAISAYAMFMTA